MVKWLLSLCILLLGLAACSGEVFDEAYTASGEGLREQDLDADEQFNSTDDFNVVVKLNRRSETVTVAAEFLDPNGDMLERIETDARDDVGTVVLGVDYELRTDVGNEWLRGRYQVNLFIDEEQVETLFFRVD